MSIPVSVIAGYGQQVFKNLPLSTDSAYGFTAGSPLKMKKGEPAESIRYAELFLGKIGSVDGQPLQYIGRFFVRDPNYKKPFLQLTDHFTGKPLTGRGGTLDIYRFIKSRTKDTVSFYVDIYHKGELKIPIGCKVEE